MLDAKGKDIDACIVTIPDFMHATAAIACMERGKHVYTQKPLVHTIEEARLMLEAAQKYKVATQMGNQGYSNEGTRQAAEIVWAGQLGNVTEVHAWTDRPWWPQGLTAIPAPDAAPATLDWDLWQGPLAKRPYTTGGAGYPNQYGNFYQPFNWRGFFDFGCGAIGDMACHILGAPNLALRLGAPTSVECIMKEGTSNFMYPKKSVLRYDFPARGNMPAVKLFWHDGMTESPKIDGVPAGELLGDLPSVPRPPRKPGDPPPPPAPRSGFIGGVFNWDASRPPVRPKRKLPSPNGSLFIGDKGMMTTGTYGEQTRACFRPPKKWRTTSSPNRCSPARPATIRIGSAPAKAATPPARTSTSPFPSSMDAARRHRAARRRQARMGCRKRANSRTTGKPTNS